MLIDERTSLLHAPSCNVGRNKVKQTDGRNNARDKLIIPIPNENSQKVFELENFSSSLSLEELLPFQDDPWWQKLRCTIFYSIWFTIFLTLITACSMAYIHSGTACRALNLIDSTTIQAITESALCCISITSDDNGKLALAP